MKGKIYTLFLVMASGVLMFILSSCGPKYPNCETDEHCASHNEYCVNGKCQQCRTDEHCNQTDKCMICGPTYTCVTKEGCCHSDLDCPGGKCWINKDTGVGECGGMCKTDADCPSGQQCKGETCVPKNECSVDSDCPQGKECEEGKCVEACTLQKIYFDFDEYVLTSEARDILKENAKCIQKKNKEVLIEGNCDERGTTEYNYQLGQKRAESAKNYLIDLGVPESLLKTTSKGEDNPVCTEHNEECWSKNRRDEFIFQ